MIQQHAPDDTVLYNTSIQYTYISQGTNKLFSHVAVNHCSTGHLPYLPTMAWVGGLRAITDVITDIKPSLFCYALT